MRKLINKKLSLFGIFLLCTAHVISQTYDIKGRVREKGRSEGVPYATVSIWKTGIGVTTDSVGNFVIKNVAPNIYRVQVACIGYKTYLSPEFKLTSRNYVTEIELEESPMTLSEVSVTASPFRRSVESPLSLRVIGLQEIEKSPGANRDISKVVNSFPGVASTVSGGYRNDLLVRGGGPSENRFYLDGVEIPNINHFSTQGASGGPVGIIDADFIREVSFYTGAFPASRGNALSSVLDFKWIDGDTERNNYKATLGASEVAFTSNGHIGKKTTYLVSARQSYLQLLFKMLGLPFLPTYTDAQFKIKHRFSYAHEFSLIGIGAIDNMRLNTGMAGDDDYKQYMLNYLPVIKQRTYTIGGVYRHYAGEHTQTVVLSRSFMRNSNEKYRNNDDSSSDNLMLKLRSDEAENHFRVENVSVVNNFRLNTGINVDYLTYDNSTRQQLFTDENRIIDYKSDLCLWKGGFYFSALYETSDNRFSSSLGFRIDANNYNEKMLQAFNQFSPRLSLSYELFKGFFLNGQVGRYYQLPSYTTMGYRMNGVLVNKKLGLKYEQCDQFGLGGEYKLGEKARFTVEGFYKAYAHMPLSLQDGIPLACKGVDYGITGDEEVVSTAKGRSYGVEFMFRWFGGDKLNILASYTLFRSEFKWPKTGKFLPSAWDNKHLFTFTGGYKLPKHWDIGAKLRLMGGPPYTPYDEDKSSLVGAWDATARPYFDYTRYNTERLKAFTQLDVRVDKSFYFKEIMFGFYIDLQNVLNTKYDNQPLYVSTGEKYTDTEGRERYKLKTIRQRSGTIVPTLGLTVEF